MAVNYPGVTSRILTEFDWYPETLQIGGDTPAVRFDNIFSILSTIAPTLVVGELHPTLVISSSYPRHGQVAQGLSDWHQYLAEQCSEVYSHLTSDPEGPTLDREKANTDKELQTLQAVRRGVRRAMNTHYRFARDSSTRKPLSAVSSLYPKELFE